MRHSRSRARVARVVSVRARRATARRRPRRASAIASAATRAREAREDETRDSFDGLASSRRFRNDAASRRRRDARGGGDDGAGDDAIGVRERRPAERADVGGARERSIQRGERDGDERDARVERRREGRASARVERDANVLREGWVRERGRTGAGDGADGWWGDRRADGAAAAAAAAAAASGSGRARGATGREDARKTSARDRETMGSVGDGTIAIATAAWSRVSAAAASVREGLARGLRRAAIASRARRDAMKSPGIATAPDTAMVRARTPDASDGRPRRLVEGRDRGRRLVAATNDDAVAAPVAIENATADDRDPRRDL